MMVTQGKRWILWCFALMFAASSQAAVSDKSLNELLSASGVEQMVNEFPQTVKLGWWKHLNSSRIRPKKKWMT